jgi:hypothetical protein
VVSDHGAVWNGSIELAAHAAHSIEPSVLDVASKSDKAAPLTSYGVGVQISGGGVVAEETAYNGRAEVPCISQGITHWSATGLSTLVGSSAYLSVFNPTATAAVFNVSIFTASGVSVPQSFQGLSVPAHAQREVNLGTEVVNTANVGVNLNVLRGSLDVIGVEDANGTLSFEQGLTSPMEDVWFPEVTTVASGSAQISVMNTGSQSATVGVHVVLGKYKITPQNVTVLPYSTGVFTVTPNSAIPADGYANVTLTSTRPIVTALATGTSTSSFSLSSPLTPGNAFLIHDFTGLGFDAMTMTNVGSRTITVDIASYNTATPKVISGVGGIKLTAGATQSLTSILRAPKGSSDTYLVSATKPSLLVSLTLPSSPRGVDVVSPLDGR